MASVRVVPSSKAGTLYTNLKIRVTEDPLQVVVERQDGSDIVRVGLTSVEATSLRSSLPAPTPTPDPTPTPTPDPTPTPTPDPTPTPTPDPTPTPTGPDGSFRGFATNPPGADYAPYSGGPWNKPISSPQVHPQSSQIITNVMSNGIGSLVTDQVESKNYGHPIYFSKPTDRTVTISTGGDLNGKKIPLPSYAVPAGGSDGHLCAIVPDPTNPNVFWEYGFWRASISGSTLTCSIGYRQPYTGPGIVTPEIIASYPKGSAIGGTTASYFGQHAGIIRGPELLAGKIEHPLFIVIAQGSKDTSFGFGTQAPGASGRNGSGSFIWPSFKGDAVGSGVLPPMGALFWLDLTEAQIDATAAPKWEKTIAKAMAKYGGYFGDTGGPGFGFQLEPAIMYRAAGRANPFEQVALDAGLKKDPTWGYTFRFSGKIDWPGRLRVLVPQR